MPRNGSGVEIKLAPSVAVPNAVITSAPYNAQIDDLVDCVNDVLMLSGVKPMTGPLAMGTQKITGLADGTARTDGISFGQVQDGKANWVAAGGTADAITATYVPAITALVDGQLCCFRATAANATTTPTFAPNGLTARTIVKQGGSALAAADIAAADAEIILRYKLASTRWELLNPKAAALSLASTTEVLTGTDAAKAVTPDALAALWEQGSDIASAGTISVGEGGYFNVTGTTTITDIDFATDKTGRGAWIKFAGALTLTHNATTLILPGGANITTAAGDTMKVISEGSDAVRVVSYNKASGVAVVVNASASMTLIATLTTTSGTSHAVTSGILSTYKYLFIDVDKVSFTAAVNLDVAVSGDGGTNYGTAVAVSQALALAADNFKGKLELHGIQSTVQNGCFGIISVGMFAAAATSLGSFGGAGVGSVTVLKHATGGTSPVNALRFTGGTFDAGEIRVYGVSF